MKLEQSIRSQAEARRDPKQARLPVSEWRAIEFVVPVRRMEPTPLHDAEGESRDGIHSSGAEPIPHSAF